MSRTAYLLAAATEVAVPVSSSSTILLVFRLVQFGFQGEHQPVVEHRMRDVLHVVRSNEVAAFRRAECLRRPDQGDALAVTARRAAGETEPRIDAAIRVAAPGIPAVEHAARELSVPAEARGVTFERLDGRHASGPAATLPIGVGRAPSTLD